MAKIVLLYTSVPSTMEITSKQDKMRHVLDVRKTPYELIDGANADNKELRAELWSISGKRAVYPQLFKLDGGSYTFLGTWEEFEPLVEMNEHDGQLDKLLSAAAQSVT